jgi:hypothetical protein
MGNSTILNEKTQSLIEDLFKRYQIRSVTIEKGLGITNSTEISDINLMFIKEQEDQSLDYPVQFKLQRECADISQYLKAINTKPAFTIELSQESEKLNAELMNSKLRSFIEVIRDRVKSAQKEQSVQNITYVGNTFILNNSTKFKVLSDEGEGRLNIEILTKDKPLDAKLTASGLLDGLYLGSIKLVEQT